MQDFFTPTERALLCDFFGMPRPEMLRDIDIEQKPECGGLWVDSDNSFALEATVAQIALAVIQDRLPQCASMWKGEFTLFRKKFARPSRSVVMLPQHLFTINWADSAPGISWPEAYNVTYIPDFDRYVVTASMDSPDMWGVTDLAIGHFATEMTILEGSKMVITGWWQEQCGDYEQGRWAYVWQEGIIDMATAEEWGDSVWPPYVAESEEDDLCTA